MWRRWLERYTTWWLGTWWHPLVVSLWLLAAALLIGYLTGGH